MRCCAAGWYVGQSVKRYICSLARRCLFLCHHHYYDHMQTSERHRDQYTIIILSISTNHQPLHFNLCLHHLKTTNLNLHLVFVSTTPSIFEKPTSDRPFSTPPTTMQTPTTLGRGGYNRNSPFLGRGGYDRDIKTSGISRPTNPSSLGVRSARCVADDGRGGYN